METFPLNRLAEILEVDRGVMVRAMRDQAPDLVQKGNRPSWKISTAAKALAAHRQKNSSSGNNSRNSSCVDPALQSLYDRFDTADAAMRAKPTLEARRAAALAMRPLIAEQDRAIRTHGRSVGIDPELADLRADKILFLIWRGFETPCLWSQVETMEAMETVSG